MHNMLMKPIYDYIDHRSFLKDRFCQLQEKNPRFSYRAFNRLLGFQSSSTLKLVLDGARNLADEGVKKICRALKLNGEESRYLDILVRYHQGVTHEEKDFYFQQLCEQRGFSRTKPLTAIQYRLFSHWYYVAILELVRLETREKKDVCWLQKHLRPSVPLADLRKAVEELKQIQLLSEDSKGSLHREDVMVRSGDEVESLFTINYHREMSELARTAVTDQDPEEREFSALTIITSDEGFAKAKKEIRKFRKRLHALMEEEAHHDKKVVAHINLQLFRLNGTMEEES